MQEPYEQLYSKFMQDYSLGVTTAEMVGTLIAKLAGYFPNYNSLMVKAERAFALVSRDEVLKVDEQSGKAISSSKAETISEASVEATAFKEARSHVQNLELLIQSAKALQRGLIQEMSYSSLG